jgi:hypothetical protein
MTQQLFKFFHNIFTTDFDEKKINPRAFSGEDFTLTISVFLVILEAKNIDFWKESILQPDWSYHLHPDDSYEKENRKPYYIPGEIGYQSASSVSRNYKYYMRTIMEYHGNPTFDNIFYEEELVNEENGEKFWSVDHIAGPRGCWLEQVIWMPDIELDYFNKLHGTSFTREDWHLCDVDEGLWADFSTKDENDTLKYLNLMAYIHTWIDRFAHKFTFSYSIDSDVAESEEAKIWQQKNPGKVPVHLFETKCCSIDETVIPPSEKLNVIVYNGITNYDCENDLYQRNGLASSGPLRMFRPEDFTTIDEIPPRLRVCWEFFKMCEPFLRELYDDNMEEDLDFNDSGDLYDSNSDDEDVTEP